MRQWIETHQVLAIALAAALLFALWYLRFVWAVALIGFIIASSFAPVIDWLQARGLPRAIAIVLLFLSIVTLIVGIFLPVVISLVSQSTGLIHDLGITVQKIFAQGSLLSQFGMNADSFVSAIESNVVPLTTTVVAAGAGFVSIIVISIYMLYDWHTRDIGSARTARMLKEIEHELGSWARGQLLLCASIGILTLIALLILHIPYAGPLAALAAIFELIPYAGPIASAIPAILLGLDVSLAEAGLVGLAYIVIQQIESHLLVPIIMQNAIRVHPVIVILALLIGFELMGIVGAIIAVPLVSIIRLLWRHTEWA